VNAAPATIRAASALDRTSVAGLVEAVDRAVAAGHRNIQVELTEVERFDSAGLGGLVESFRSAKSQGADVRLRGVSEGMLEFFGLVSMERLLAAEAPVAQVGTVERVGERVVPILDAAAGVCRTGLEVLAGIFVAPFRGQRLRLDRTIHEVDHAGIGALPIIALVAFLMGLILAMQAWVQLRVWGAEIYMADMVGVSVLTEIGPLMAAIILAARSGSSNAAQLGAMVVGEEIDALRQMGVDPVRFLVVPKVLALALATAGLVLLFDVLAMAGGALFARTVADIEFAAYLEQTQTALRLGEFLMAIGKSVVFGTCIGVVGCGLGLQVRGGSAGVARATTNAVVLSIFLVILIDCAFVTVQRLALG